MPEKFIVKSCRSAVIHFRFDEMIIPELIRHENNY